MYEKTIAGDFRIYEITLPTSRTRLVDLLSPADRAEYEDILDGDGLGSTREIKGRPHQKYRRAPIDGYIVSQAEFSIAHSATSTALEPVNPSTQYTVPVYFWPEKVWIVGDGMTPAIIRIFFN